jgi:hypothetical protein
MQKLRSSEVQQLGKDKRFVVAVTELPNFRASELLLVCHIAQSRYIRYNFLIILFLIKKKVKEQFL